MNDTLPVPGYWIDPLAVQQGLSVRVILVLGCQIERRHEGLERLKHEQLRQYRYDPEDPVLRGYRAIFHALGIAGAVASPEALHLLIASRGRLPQISTAVDAYNLVSVERNVVLSAHDLDCLTGHVRLEMAAGGERFVALNGRTEHLAGSEWYIRDDRHLLCRMNCKQSELSKVGLDTRNLLLYAQGSRATSASYLQESLEAAAERIVEFCGGRIWPLRELRDESTPTAAPGLRNQPIQETAR